MAIHTAGSNPKIYSNNEKHNEVRGKNSIENKLRKQLRRNICGNYKVIFEDGKLHRLVLYFDKNAKNI